MGYSILKTIKSRLNTEYPIKIGDIPDKPNNIIVLRETNGIRNNGSQLIENNRDEDIYTTLSILIRLENKDMAYENCIDELDNLVDDVASLLNMTVEDKFISRFDSENIIPIGVDKENRYNASVNINLTYYRV